MQRISFIEVITVLAVPLILAAMAMPKMAVTEKRSNQSVCIENMNSIALAITRWEEANHRFWPEGWIKKTPAFQSRYDLTPYLSSKEALDCPSVDDPEHEYYFCRTSSNDLQAGVNCYFCHTGEYPHRIAQN